MIRLLTLAVFVLILGPGPLAAVGQESSTITTNGIDIHYKTIGDGPRLLLLHGYGGSGEDWQQLIPKLSAHFKLIVPDLRGHGRSGFNKKLFTHRQAAKDVLAVLDKLEIESTAAIGNSTGAMTLLHIATIEPGRVRAMVLHAGTPYFPDTAREIMATVTLDGESELGDYFGDERMSRVHAGGPKQYRWLRESFRSMKDNYEDMNFSPPLLGTITASTLIIHGDRDEFVTIELPVMLYKHIPDTKLWVVPGQGHNGAFDPAKPTCTPFAGLPFVSTCLDHLRRDADGDRTTEPNDASESPK